LLGLESNEPAELSGLLKRLVDSGLAVTEFHRESRKLEDAFVEMIKKVEPLRPPEPIVPDGEN
jgi:ABC-2 type transport system ATP-binding protein